MSEHCGTAGGFRLVPTRIGYSTMPRRGVLSGVDRNLDHHPLRPCDIVGLVRCVNSSALASMRRSMTSMAPVFSPGCWGNLCAQHGTCAVLFECMSVMLCVRASSCILNDFGIKHRHSFRAMFSTMVIAVLLLFRSSVIDAICCVENIPNAPSRSVDPHGANINFLERREKS